MLPFHFSLGPLAITPNELFAVLGVVLAGLIIRHRLIALGTDDGGFLDFVLAAIAGGAVGSRLYYFIPMWIRGQIRAGTLVTTWSDGSGYYGGFLLGAVAVAWVAKVKKMKPLLVLDAVAAVVPFGFAIGKIGCFLAGCCYGRRTPSGLSFARGSLCYHTQQAAGLIGRNASASLPVHPVQLYDMGFGFALFGFLLLLAKRSRRPGEVLCAYVLLYSAYRFVIEFFRDDPDRHTFGGNALTDSQFTALALLGIAGAAWIWIRLKKLPTEPAPATPK